MPYQLMLIQHGPEEEFNQRHELMPHCGSARSFKNIKVTVLTYRPVLGQWLACSHLVAKTLVQDPAQWHMIMAVACSGEF